MSFLYREFDRQNWTSRHRPTKKQLETMRQDGINGVPNFLAWFRDHVKDANIHEDLWQLSYGWVNVRSYGRYDVNGFRFRSTQFEALRPLAATTNSGVVTRAIDEEVREINYYGIINNILEFSFAGNKKLKVVFFDCDWFDINHGTRQNQSSMVEVKHNERTCHAVERTWVIGSSRCFTTARLCSF